MHKVKFVLVLALVFSFCRLSGQEVTTTLEPDSILIGEQADFTFSVTLSPDAVLEMPVLNENLTEKIEIVNYGQVDTIAAAGNKITLKRTLRVTSWEEGFHAIAPIEMQVVQGTDTATVTTEPVLLQVTPFEVEEQAQLKDIKPILKVPVTLAELKYYILGLLVLGVLIWLLVRFLKRPRKAPVVESIWEKPDIPAHVAAINSLEHLKAQKLWQQGKVKEYHIELNNILRHYIEKRFHIGAMEKTTSEILPALQPIHEIDPVRKDLHWMMYLADMVKFAKQIPSGAENERCMDLAFEFVNTTRPVEVKEQKQA